MLPGHSKKKEWRATLGRSLTLTCPPPHPFSLNQTPRNICAYDRLEGLEEDQHQGWVIQHNASSLHCSSTHNRLTSLCCMSLCFYTCKALRRLNDTRNRSNDARWKQPSTPRWPRFVHKSFVHHIASSAGVSHPKPLSLHTQQHAARTRTLPNCALTPAPSSPPLNTIYS